MREIKFRAWDKIERHMFLGSGPGFSNQTLEIETIDVLFDWDGNDFSEVIHRFEIMQYTGLKDKNGKEIYEGDCLRYDIIEGAKGNVPGEVEFLNGSFGVRHYDLLTFGEVNNLEVIGNIHENPALLQ